MRLSIECGIRVFYKTSNRCNNWVSLTVVNRLFALQKAKRCPSWWNFGGYPARFYTWPSSVLVCINYGVKDINSFIRIFADATSRVGRKTLRN